MNFRLNSPTVIYLLTTLLLLLIIVCFGEYRANAATVIINRGRTRNQSQTNLAKSFQSLPKRSACYSSRLGKLAAVPGYYRLSENVIPSRYRIRFRVEPRRHKLYGHVQIAIYIHNRTNAIELNSVKLSINGAAFRTGNIRVDASMVYYCPEKETIILEFPKPLHRGSANLTINFFGNLTEMMESGLMKMRDNNRVMITDFGPIDARRNFPCFDEPRFRTVFDLYLIVPLGYTALSNAVSNRRRPYSSEYEEIRFESTPLMSPFQLSAIFGPKFEVATNNHSLNASATSSSKVLIQVFSIASQTYPKKPKPNSPNNNNQEFQYAIETTEKFLKYYEYYFDQQFPLKRLNLVAIKDYEQMSLEKLGLILFPRRQLSIGNSTLATEDELRSVTESIGHSVSHQWLGNLVTFSEWNQFWLCEGFASFMEKEALDTLFPHWKTWQRFAANEMRVGLDQDASCYSKALSKQINHPNDIVQFYSNENVYRKSIALLRMLRFAIGDETFQKATRLFIKTFTNNRAATAADLLQCFYNATEKSEQNQQRAELAQIIARWTELAGFPVLHVDERQEEGEIRVLKLSQERFVALNRNESSWNGPGWNDTWLIPINIINSFSPFSVSFQTVMTVKEAELSLNGIWEGEWVKLNPDFSNFYRVHYSERMLNKFVVSIEEKLLPPMDRLNLVDDLFALIRAGYTTTDVGFRFLWSYENEDNPNVWASILSSLTDIDILISNIPENKSTNLVDEILDQGSTLSERYWNFGRDLLSSMYRRLYWYPDTKFQSVGYRTKLDDFAQQTLRENILCMMGRFRDDNFTNVATEKFKDYIDGKSDLDLGVMRCVFRAFSLFDQKQRNITFDELFTYYREYDYPEARDLFSIALGSTDQSEQIQKVINFSLDPVVRSEDTHTMIKELCQTSAVGRRMVLTTLNKQFYKFATKFGDFSAMHHFFKSIIESISDESQLTQLKQLLSGESTTLRWLFESLRYSFERVQLFQRWIERDQTIIEQFFEDNPKTLLVTSPDAVDNFEFNFEDFDKKKKKK